jgi:hypothetical protein
VDDWVNPYQANEAQDPKTWEGDYLDRRYEAAAFCFFIKKRWKQCRRYILL